MSHSVHFPISSSQVIVGGALAASCLLALGCDSTPPSGPAPSRVQAVLQTGATQPVDAPKAAAAPSTPSSTHSARPRGTFCPAPSKLELFSPKGHLELVAAPGIQPTAQHPLASKTNRWRWINFWAAWCVPCKQELPLLLGWSSLLADSVDFSFVSLDDDQRQLDQFLTAQPLAGLKSTYWLPDGPQRQTWLAALGLSSEPELPMQLLLNPKGELRCKIEGAVEADDLSSLRQVIAAK